MTDLGQLARWPRPAYRTVQFSSYDRRSTTSETPGWFANADGFGGEPIPGFLKVLREPRDRQAGLFLMRNTAAQAPLCAVGRQGWAGF
jgi:hypothetical protein